MVEISVEPLPECYVKGILEQARLKTYPAYIDQSTGVGTVTIYPTYNASYTFLLGRYGKAYLIVLASPSECLAKIESNKPVKRLSEGYYRVGPWLTGGPTRDFGDLKLVVAENCRFLRWEAPYEFTSLYQGLSQIFGISPEKNMTITAIFENLTAPPAIQASARREEGGGIGQPPAASIPPKLPQELIGGGLLAAFLLTAAYGSFKAVKWAEKRSKERRKAREEALKTLCLMEKAAAGMRSDAHPLIGVFNLIARGYSLEDMASALAGADKMAEAVDSVYLSQELRNVQQLIQLGELIRSRREPEETGAVQEEYEAALAGYLALVAAMPCGREAEKFMDEAIGLASRFEALDKISREAAIDEILEEFSSLARRWVGSSTLRTIAASLRSMLEKAGVWSRCRRPPRRICRVLQAIIGPEKLAAYGLAGEAAAEKEVCIVEAFSKPEEEARLEEAICPKCGKALPRHVWEKVSFCPLCGARLKTETAEKPEEEAAEKPEALIEVEGGKAASELEEQLPESVINWCRNHGVGLEELLRAAEAAKKTRASRDKIYMLVEKLLKKRSKARPTYQEVVEGGHALLSAISILEKLGIEVGKGASELKLTRPPASGGDVKGIFEEDGRLRFRPKTIYCFSKHSCWTTPPGLYAYLPSRPWITVEIVREPELNSLIQLAKGGLFVIFTRPGYAVRLARWRKPPTIDLLTHEKDRLYADRLTHLLRNLEDVCLIVTNYALNSVIRRLGIASDYEVIDVQSMQSKASEMLVEAGLSDRAAILSEFQKVCPAFASTLRELRSREPEKPLDELARQAVEKLYSRHLEPELVEILGRCVEEIVKSGSRPVMPYKRRLSWLGELDLVTWIPGEGE